MENKNIEISINNYDGPLDMLLSLIKDKHMDIFSIDLVELTDKYVKVIDELKHEDIDIASEYLVMAATLLQLKAKLLLDNPTDRKEAEEEKQEVLQQLIEHQQFKNVAKKLRINEKERRQIFTKTPEPYEKYAIVQDESRLDGKSDAVKLIMQMRKMFERIHAKQLRDTTIEKFNLSPAERRVQIVEMLKTNENPTFEDFFKVPTINHFVVTMLTILDMARKQELKLEQDDQFGNIIIKKGIING